MIIIIIIIIIIIMKLIIIIIIIIIIIKVWFCRDLTVAIKSKYWTGVLHQRI